MRQVMVGRATETPSDLKDLTLALLSGDMNAVGEIAGRRGENVTTGISGGSIPVVTSGSGTGELSSMMRSLASKARGYRLGSTGPDYYDCSGLVWVAMRELGIFDGPRFTTHVFASVAASQGWEVLDGPEPDAVICWRAKHMGVSLGGDRMFSARSAAKGIGESSVSGDSGYFGMQPIYYRVTGKR